MIIVSDINAHVLRPTTEAKPRNGKAEYGRCSRPIVRSLPQQFVYLRVSKASLRLIETERHAFPVSNDEKML